MNVKALLCGVVLGATIAWVPACGGSACGPSNCETCCDAKGACVVAPQNAAATSCGKTGGLCVDCSASLLACDPATFTCSGASDAGACDGCVLPNGQCSPLQLSRSSVTNCGMGGVSCASCTTGQLCTNGVCGSTDLKKVGDPCNSDTDCRMLGSTAICKKMTSSGNGTYLDGYCTLACTDTDCPAGSSCISLNPRYGEGDSICWDSCSVSDKCRVSGYGCYQLGDIDACWLDPLPPVDAGVPADKVGNPCTSDSACQNPPDNGGTCLQSEFGEEWPQGYCTKIDCIENEECSTDGGAMCLDFRGEANACVQRCADASDGGRSTCREGYVCTEYQIEFSDGGVGTAETGFCAPLPPPVPTTVGDSCTESAACQVPSGADALCVPAILPDGGLSGFTDGYCTRVDCEGSEDCSQDGGAQCLVLGSTTGCFRICSAPETGQSDCRVGYSCFGYRLIDGGASPQGVCDRACTAPGFPGCTSGTCEISTGYCK